MIKVYADKDFYETVFLKGRPPIVPLDQFNGWAQDASAEITRVTFNRVDMNDIPIEVKMATCAVAQFMFANSESRGLRRIQSVSVPDSISRTFVDQRQKNEDYQKELSDVINKWLSGVSVDGVSLLFRGVR